MASGSVTLFSKNKDDFRVNDIVGATIKAALVSSSWTPDTSTTGTASGLTCRRTKSAARLDCWRGNAHVGRSNSHLRRAQSFFGEP